MNKKIAAIIAEIVPIVSAVAAYALILSALDAAWVRRVIAVTMLLAFLGVAVFFVGRKLAGGDRAVKILGILDCLATAFVIGLYVIAIIAFGM